MRGYLCFDTKRSYFWGHLSTLFTTKDMSFPGNTLPRNLFCLEMKVNTPAFWVVLFFYPFNVILLNTFRFQGTCSWIVHLYLLYQSLMLLWVYINRYVGKYKIVNFYFGEHILLLQKICIWLPGTLSVAHNSVRSRGSPEWVKSWVDMFIVNMNQPSQVP